jgi:hypothetical protein
MSFGLAMTIRLQLVATGAVARDCHLLFISL